MTRAYGVLPRLDGVRTYGEGRTQGRISSVMTPIVKHVDLKICVTSSAIMAAY